MASLIRARAALVFGVSTLVEFRMR
jgi:hypothetical protein